jgi:hypothetical protein
VRIPWRRFSVLLVSVVRMAFKQCLVMLAVWMRDQVTVWGMNQNIRLVSFEQQKAQHMLGFLILMLALSTGSVKLTVMVLMTSIYHL